MFKRESVRTVWLLRGAVLVIVAAASACSGSQTPTVTRESASSNASNGVVSSTSTRTPTPNLAPPPTAVPLPTSTNIVHVVQPGETLGGIAKQYDVSLEALVAANDIADPNRIRTGQELAVPPPGAAIATPLTVIPGTAETPVSAETPMSTDSFPGQIEMHMPIIAEVSQWRYEVLDVSVAPAATWGEQSVEANGVFVAIHISIENRNDLEQWFDFGDVGLLIDGESDPLGVDGPATTILGMQAGIEQGVGISGLACQPGVETYQVLAFDVPSVPRTQLQLRIADTVLELGSANIAALPTPRVVPTPRATSTTAPTEEPRFVRQRLNTSGACRMSHEFVKGELWAPGTARFESCWNAAIGPWSDDPWKWMVESFVDSENRFGGMVRTPYSCVMVKTSDGWQLVNLWFQDRGTGKWELDEPGVVGE